MRSVAAAEGACATAAVEDGACSSTVQAGCRRSRLCTKAVAVMAPAGAHCHISHAMKAQHRVFYMLMHKVLQSVVQACTCYKTGR